MFLTSLLATRSRNDLQCFQYDSSLADKYYDYNTKGTILNQSVENIRYVHLACFVLLLMQEIINFYSVHMYQSYILGSLSIPIYIIGILRL